MHCAACHREIPAGQQSYTLRVDLFACAGAPEITQADLDRDVSTELDRLAARLARLDPQEVQEETDRIFERHLYTLCSACRGEFHDLLKEPQL